MLSRRKRWLLTLLSGGGLGYVKFDFSQAIISEGKLTNVIGNEWNVTRASEAEFLDGTFQMADPNFARIQSDGVMVEPFGQQKNKFSSLSHVNWIKGNCTAVIDGTILGVDATKITPNDLSTTHHIRKGPVVVPLSSEIHFRSDIIEPNGLQYFFMGTYNGVSVSRMCKVDVINNTLVYRGSDLITGGVIDIEGGFKQIWCTYRPNGEVVNDYYIQATDLAGSDTGFVGDGIKSFRVINSSIMQGDELYSTLPSSNTLPIREPDVISMKIPTKCTWVAEWINNIQSPLIPVVGGDTYFMKNKTTRLVMGAEGTELYNQKWPAKIIYSLTKRDEFAVVSCGLRRQQFGQRADLLLNTDGSHPTMESLIASPGTNIPLMTLREWYGDDTAGIAIHRWNDQSGNEHHAEIDINVRMALLVTSAGEIVTDPDNGLPALSFTGIRYMNSEVFPLVPQPTTKILKASHRTSGYVGYAVSGSTANRQDIGMDVADDHWRLYAGVVNDYATGPVLDQSYLHFARFDGANSELFIDNVSQGIKDVGTHGLEQIALASTITHSQYWDGFMQELIVHTEDMTAYQAAINADIVAKFTP